MIRHYDTLIYCPSSKLPCENLNFIKLIRLPKESDATLTFHYECAANPISLFDARFSGFIFRLVRKYKCQTILGQ